MCLADQNSRNPSNVNGQLNELDGFLKEIVKLLRAEINGNAKIVISGLQTVEFCCYLGY